MKINIKKLQSELKTEKFKGNVLKFMVKANSIFIVLNIFLSSGMIDLFNIEVNYHYLLKSTFLFYNSLLIIVIIFYMPNVVKSYRNTLFYLCIGLFMFGLYYWINFILDNITLFNIFY